MFKFFQVVGRASLFACVVTTAVVSEEVQAASSQQQFPFAPPGMGAGTYGYGPQLTCFTGQFPGGAQLGLSGAYAGSSVSDGFMGPLSGGPLVWSPTASAPYSPSLDQVQVGRQISMPGYVANDAMYARVGETLNLSPDRVREALRQAAAQVSAPTGRPGEMVAGVRLDDSRIAQSLGVTTERWREASQRAISVNHSGGTSSWGGGAFLTLDELAMRLAQSLGVSVDRARGALNQPIMTAGQSLFDDEVNTRLAQALGVSAERLREAIRQQVPMHGSDSPFAAVPATSYSAGYPNGGMAGQYLGGSMNIDPAQCSPAGPSQFGNAPLPYQSLSGPRGWPFQSPMSYPWSPIAR